MNVTIYDTFIGKTLTHVFRIDETTSYTLTFDGHTTSYYNDALVFICDDGTIFEMSHSQDCCESVNIDDIVGDLEDLIGSPIVEAEEVSECTSLYESETWTFYKIGTLKGGVHIRWYGTSNGYYSEDVYFGEKEKWW